MERGFALLGAVVSVRADAALSEVENGVSSFALRVHLAFSVVAHVELLDTLAPV